MTGRLAVRGVLVERAVARADLEQRPPHRGAHHAHEHALRELPALDHAMSTGALTLDQVAAAAEFATPASDAELARIAVGKAPGAIALAARTIVPPAVLDDQELYERRALSMTWTRGRRELVLRAAAARAGHRLRAGHLEHRQAPTGRGQEGRRRARLAAVRRGRARHPRAPAGGADGGARRSPSTLIVHLSEDAPPLLEGAGPISAETAERLVCDARRLEIKPSGRDLVHSRVGRCASYAQQRALHKRSSHCQYPGCTAARELEAHHVACSRARRQDRAGQPDPALPPPPQAAPRPPHPHQRQR